MCPLRYIQQRCKKQACACPDLACLDQEPRDEGTSQGVWLEEPHVPHPANVVFLPRYRPIVASFLAHWWRTAQVAIPHPPGCGGSWDRTFGITTGQAGNTRLVQISHKALIALTWVAGFISSTFWKQNRNAIAIVSEENICIDNFAWLCTELNNPGLSHTVWWGQPSPKTPRPSSLRPAGHSQQAPKHPHVAGLFPGPFVAESPWLNLVAPAETVPSATGQEPYSGLGPCSILCLKHSISLNASCF